MVQFNFSLVMMDFIYINYNVLNVQVILYHLQKEGTVLNAQEFYLETLMLIGLLVMIKFAKSFIVIQFHSSQILHLVFSI